MILFWVFFCFFAHVNFFEIYKSRSSQFLFLPIDSHIFLSIQLVVSEFAYSTDKYNVVFWTFGGEDILRLSFFVYSFTGLREFQSSFEISSSHLEIKLFAFSFYSVFSLVHACSIPPIAKPLTVI